MKIKSIWTKLTDKWLIKVVSILLALVIFQFYKRSLLDKRYFSVPLNIQNTGKLVPASTYPRTVKISIWGEAMSIATVHEEDISAYLDLDQYTVAAEYNVPIRIKLSGTALNIQPLEVSAEPQDIRLKLEHSVTKRVPIILSLKGMPAENFEISETITDPATVEIMGPEFAIGKISNMITESILIEDRNISFEGVATILNTNPLIWILSKSQIEYKVKIKEEVLSNQYTLNTINVLDLAPNLNITNILPNIDVKVSGNKTFVESWTPSNKFLQINCSDIKEPGVYQLPIIAERYDKMSIVSINPKTVQVVVEEVATEE